MRFSRRVPHEPPNHWTTRFEELRLRGARFVDLTDANPTRVGLAPDPEVVARIARDAEDPRYDPDPCGADVARREVARYVGDRRGAVFIENVVLTSGTSEAYAHLFRVLCDPGDAVLVPEPSYPLFEPLARAEGVRTRAYHLRHDGAWHLDAESLGEADARAVIVVQPNHPTGSMLAPDEVEHVVSWCERHGAALIVDEVFGDYAWDPHPEPAFPTLSGHVRVPTFVLSGLSKVCGLPQMKASWIAASGPEAAVRQAVLRLTWLADLFLSVSAPAQHAVTRGLPAREAFQARVRERVERNRRALAGFVREHPEVTWLAGNGGWAAILRLPARRSEDEWIVEAFERRLLVHPGHFYDVPFDPSIVLSLIVDPETWDRGLERLAELIRA
jgi:alanine-synthesizing transaminase